MNQLRITLFHKLLVLGLIALSLQTIARAQQGVWETYGPDLSLSVSAIYQDADDPLRIYVGTLRTGLFYSSNGGVNWEQSPPPMTSGCVSAIIEHQDRLYVGSFDLDSGCGEESGLFASDDGGLSWIGFPQFSEIYALLCIGSRLLIAGEGGVFYTDDNGGSWQSDPNMDVNLVFSLFEYRGMVYAGSFSQGVFFSADSGETWQHSIADPPGVGQYLTVFAGIDSIVVAGSNIGCCGFDGLLLSHDGGATFESPSPELLFNPIYDLHRLGDRLYAATSNGVFFSPDIGETWLQGGGAVAGQTILSLGSQGNVVLAGSNAGSVFKSVDAGMSWSEVDFPGSGFAISNFLAIDNVLFAGTDGTGLYISANSGDTWFPRQIQASQKAAGMLLNPFFFLSYGEGIYRSVDGGLSWHPAEPPLNTIPVSKVVEQNKKFYAATNDGLWIGADGVRWNRATPPLDGGILNDILFANDVGLAAGPGLFYSTDGENWLLAGFPAITVLTLLHGNGEFYAGVVAGGVLRATTPQGPWERVTGLIANKTVRHLFASDGILYAATHLNGIYRSEDGATWTAVGPSDLAVNDIASYNNSLYAATGSATGGRTKSGLFTSADLGLTWDQVTLPDNQVDLLSFLEINGFLYAGGSKTFVTGNGIRWTPLGLGLRTGRVNLLASYPFPGEIRLYGASQNGVFLQRIDQTPPVAVEVNAVSKSGFVSNTDISLTLQALGADSVDISEDSTFASANWQPYSNLLNHSLSPNDGEKKIFSRFKDLSWNLSQTIHTSVILDTEPPSFFVHQPPQSADPDSTLVFTQAVSDPNLAEVALYYRRPGEPFSENRRSVFQGDSATVDGLFITPRGLDYRIIATDRAGLRDTLRNETLGFFSLPVSVAANGLGSSPGLPGGTGGAAFRIVSVPMRLDENPSARSVLGDLGKYGTGGDWLFWDYQGNDQWSNSENTELETGMGYFLLLRNGRTLSNQISGSTALTTSGLRGEIPGWQLGGGDWTLVGNPYSTRIDLGQLKLSHLNRRLIEPDPGYQIWSYDGRSENNGWTNENIALQPWGGLAVYVSQADTIVFANADDPFAPPDFGKAESISSMKISSASEWLVNVVAEIKGFSDRVNRFGVRSDARIGLDAHDWHEPPMLPGGVSISFPHPEWDDPGVFASDIRPVSDQGYQWPLRVSASSGKAVSLTFSGLENLPPGYDALLLDPGTGLLRDLNIQGDVVVRIPDGTRHKELTLVVGQSEYVAQATDGFSSVPSDFSLDQNYPNPFNPTTTIRYGLPSAGQVTLKIYDLLGTEVSTMLNRVERLPGYYEEVADLRSLGSGIYFYQIEVEGEHLFRQVRKMILAK